MGMRMQNIRMSTTMDKAKLVELVRANLESHKAEVAQANEGYIKKAKLEANKIVAALRDNKPVRISSALTPPPDYSSTYESVLSMLEHNTASEVVLEADEFRQLVLNEWDWMDGFKQTLSFYGGSAGRSAGDSAGGSTK